MITATASFVSARANTTTTATTSLPFQESMMAAMGTRWNGNTGGCKENKPFHGCVNKRDGSLLSVQEESTISKRRRVDHGCHYSSNDHKTKRDRLVDAMWSEAQEYWLVVSRHPQEDNVVEEEIAKLLLRGLQVESFCTQSLPLPSGNLVVNAAEQLELVFSMPTSPRDGDRTSYRWSVSWYDVQGPMHSAVAGSMRCQPFVQDALHGNAVTVRSHMDIPELEGDTNNDEGVVVALNGPQIRSGWNLKPLDHWKYECTQWLKGANIPVNAVKLETVARLVVAGVGILARDRLAVKDNLTTPNWIFRRTMLRLERELQTWNNENAKNPNEMEMSEIIARRGGLRSDPRVVEALRRENRWQKPVLYQ